MVYVVSFSINFTDGDGTWTAQNDGTIIFAPAHAGTFMRTYTIQDTFGQTSNQAAINFLGSVGA